MAIFGRKKKKDKRLGSIEQAPTKQQDETQISFFDSEEVIPVTKSTSSKRRKSHSPVQATMDMLPELVEHLATSADTSGEVPARALRMLFSLSESSETDNRIEMVRDAQGLLVPELLDFLKRCERGSSEQYLALLVLNNISIPSQNKRCIALDCGGAQVLARLLCLDPSCHLMAIILVNLTFCDADLRKELVLKSNIELIESLSFALRVASFTQEEYDIRQPLSVPNEHEQYTPRDLLDFVVQEDPNFDNDGLLNPSGMLYPETARWCLSALKNLSRPCKDSPAAQVLVKSGIVSHILRFVSIGEPIEADDYLNVPTTWQSNSMQDAALFVIMNLAAMKLSREHVIELNGVDTLTRITEYNKQHRREAAGDSSDEQKQLEFQCLKAVSLVVMSGFFVFLLLSFLSGLLTLCPSFVENGFGVSDCIRRSFWSASASSFVEWLQ